VNATAAYFFFAAFFVAFFAAFFLAAMVLAPDEEWCVPADPPVDRWVRKARPLVRIHDFLTP
jgi:hypothetical protein